MAEIRSGAPPAKLVVGAFGGFPELFERLLETLTERYGPRDLETPLLEFPETTHYAPTMGPGLKRIFYSFERLVAQESLGEAKLESYRIEESLARTSHFPVPRPVNIDPGLVTRGAFILASAKEAAQRIYRGRGIYEEVTLVYHHGGFRELPWTYPEFRDPSRRRFLEEVRRRYLERLRRRPR